MKSAVLAALLSLASAGLACAQQAHLITVTGEALVNVKPDRVVITLGIETSDMNILTAKQKNNDILRKAVAVAKELGVAEKEIQTDSLSIAPRYRDSYTKETFLGYFVQNTVVVTLSDTGKLEEFLTQILQAGVHNIQGIDFRTLELRKYRDQAREMALKAAREKADKMAATLGQAVGAPTQINENGGGWYGWGYGRYGRNQGMSQNIAQDVGGDNGEITDTIALGKIAVRATVTVSFELKNR